VSAIKKMKNCSGFTLISKAFKGFTLIRTLLRKNLDKVQPRRGFTLISKACQGFTLIELLIVMAILGILATVGLNSFRSSQLKSRDAKRKSDLEQVQRALEMYYNDYGNYPGSEGGKIKIEVALTWGSAEMKDSNTLYMKELPKDPTGNPEYCYSKNDLPSGYKLYAKLENGQDPHCIGGICTPPSADCGGLTKAYNYGVASSNLSPLSP